MKKFDLEAHSWKYDIETYERCKLIISKLDTLKNTNNRDFWRDRANAIVDKYPQARLERVQ